ncbi:MAG: hypothetical protein JW827_00475 [Spirochaetes bacterium]|nr:hypothetical protein [Spirochaetota bacterium]
MQRKIIIILLCWFIKSLFAQTNSFRQFNHGIKIDKDYIYLNEVKFLIKGISYNPYYPGERNGLDFKKANFQLDIQLIKKANINTVMLYWIRPLKIYELCRQYDIKIMQGIVVPETEDYQNERFKKQVKKSIKYLVDYIHRHNFSDLIMAYFIGGEFDPLSIKTSNRKNKTKENYPSENFQVDRKLNSVENFLLEMADYLKTYEMTNYQVSHIVSHIHWPYAEKDMKIDFLDMAMFDIYSFWPPEVSHYHGGSFTQTSYQGYIEYIKSKYKNIPVFISEFGYSTAPQDDTISVDEKTQAYGLVERWIDILTSSRPLAGGSVFEYNDEWWKQAKAAEFVGFDKDPQFHDKDDAEEWFGIISIDGPSYRTYDVRPKMAYEYVKNMYSPEFNAFEFYKKLSETGGEDKKDIDHDIKGGK